VPHVLGVHELKLVVAYKAQLDYGFQIMAQRCI
jgi:hypothetical protein